MSEMAFVQSTSVGDSPALKWGPSGTPYVYDLEDETSMLVALTKAVNDGLEAGEEIEGELASIVADVLKEVVFSQDNSFAGLLCEIREALPTDPKMSYYVEDVDLAQSKALICCYGMDEGGGGKYVAGFQRMGDEVVVDPRTNWIEVEPETQYASKAGRVLSSHNLAAVEAAIEALNAVADGERSRRTVEEPEEEETEKSAEEVEYVITKSDDEQRFTLGPLYAPNRKDAHGEWTDEETLQKGLWEYVRESADNGRRLLLQHGDEGETTVGEWVEVMAWPYEHTIKIREVGGKEREVSMPAGTVYMGVVWDEGSWPDVKSGKLGGYSLGGRAVKVKAGPLEEMEKMGDA